MDCATAIATRLLGETTSERARRQAERHIATCPACASTLMLDPVADDESESANPTPSRTGAGLLRWGLLAGSILQLAFALPWLFGFDPLGGLGREPDAAHLTRDGAIGLFVAAAGLAAWRSARWAGPAVAAIALGVTGHVAAGLIDHQRDHVHGWFEAVHVLTIAILALTVIEAMRARRRFRAPQRDLRPRTVSRLG